MQRKREPLHSLGHRIGSLQSRGGNGFFSSFFCWDGEKNHLSPAKPKLFFHSILPSFNTHPRQTGNYSQRRQWRFFFWQQLLPLSHQKSFAAPFFISLGHRFYAEVFPVTVFSIASHSHSWSEVPPLPRYASMHWEKWMCYRIKVTPGSDRTVSLQHSFV